MDTLAKVISVPETLPATALPHVSQNTTPAAQEKDAQASRTEKETDLEDSSSTSPSMLRAPDKEAPAEGATAADTASQAGDDGSAGHLTGLKLFAVMSSITLVAFLMLLDTSIIATAIPYITNEFHSLPDVGWYGSAYQLASAALQPLTGKIYSKFNVKWSFLFFFALFELGSLICGLANSSKMLIVGRAVAGMGGAGLMNGAMTIIAGAVPLHRQPMLLGILMGCAQLGVVSGPLIGGGFTEYVSWRWCFYINLPIGAVVFGYLIFVRVPEPAGKPAPRAVLRTLHHELDLVGFALLAPAAIQLLLALQWGGNTYAWNSATIIGLFCGAGCTFLVWLVWDWRSGDAALIPLSMMGRRAVWSSAVTSTSLYIALMLMAYYMPIYFQSVKGATPSESGVDVLPAILGQLVSAVLTGALVSRTGYTVPYSVLSSVIISISSGLLSRLSPSTRTVEWAGLQVMSGIGRGLGMQMPIIAMQTVLKPSEISVANSMLMFSQFIGTSVFLSVASTLFNESLRSQVIAHAPNVNVDMVVAAGATGFRNFVFGDDLPGVILAYANTVNQVFYLITGAGSVAFFSAWFMGWVDIRKKKTAKPGAEQA